MYDDATSTAPHSFGIVTRLKKNTLEASDSGAQFGLNKTIAGSPECILIGKLVVRGIVMITFERLENYISGPVYPYFAAELRSKLCCLSWSPECLGRWYGLCLLVLGWWAR